MRIILLKFALCMIVIAIGGCIFYVLKNNHDARQLATPEQLTDIAKQTPAQQKHLRRLLSLIPMVISPVL